MSDVLIKQKASQCVKCGVCVPQCPTYAQTLSENDSPRGRIALIQALAEKQLPNSARLAQHLDQCLNCGRCEQVCPSDVDYTQLIHAARNRLRDHNQLPWQNRWCQSMVEILITRPFLLRAIAFILASLQRFRQQPLTAWPRISSKRLAVFYPAKGIEQGRVGLLTGCIAHYFDAQTLQAAIKVLTSLGFGVYIPRAQTCCGAIHLHAGKAAKAAQLSAQNQHVFTSLPIKTVLTLASGCQAVLTEQPLYQDIQAFLLALFAAKPAVFKPLNKTVMVHIPCTLTNALDAPMRTTALLKYIPGLKLRLLSQKPACCGAAGTYMLRHTTLARAIGMDLIDAADFSDIETLISCNVGCALHLAILLQKRAVIRVLHPIQLLAEQLFQ